MIIPPAHMANQFKPSGSGEGVYLETSHICFGKDVCDAIFKEDQHLHIAIYPKKGYLLAAPISHTYFGKMHKSSQHLLKMKNAVGDKSVAIHELIIDHEIVIKDGPLEYEIREKTGIIKIFLK